MEHEQGYVIMALQHEQADYLRMATALAVSVRYWHPHSKICLITDSEYTSPVFDFHQRIRRTDPANAWADDWQCFVQTPFRETIKLEADMLVVSPIDHWWSLCRHRDVLISVGCKNWKNQVSGNRVYRRIFDDNDLPDVYNAVTYWRLSETARNFWVTVRDIFQNWDHWKQCIKFADSVPSTDLVYAMAAQILGPELVTMPFASYPRITHMKQHHAGTRTHSWSNELVWEMLDGNLRIQTVAQHGAVHYVDKHWQL